MPFPITFTPSAEADLAYFKVVDQRIIMEAIRAHLLTDPGRESRRKKRLTANPLAPWELRVGDHRVFYEVEGVARVTVLAIGIKALNDLFIRGRKVEL